MTAEDRRERLHEEFERMNQLRSLNVGLIDFTNDGLSPPLGYHLTLYCEGRRLRNGKVRKMSPHQVSIFLGPNYPDEAPVLQWRTPILHPNIQAPGVCLLGGWSSHTRLDRVCEWLWDMGRLQLYNTAKDKYWDEAAVKWVEKGEETLPVDSRRLTTLPLPGAAPVDLEDLKTKIRVL